MKYLLPLASLVMLAAPVTAQDLANQEIVVTATRVTQSATRDREDGPISAMPAVGLRQPADFLVQKVIIRGDTRDPEQRSREIRTMLGDAIRRADAAGVELAYGDYILTRLTPENAEDIALQRDNRPDSERVEFLVKARLGKTQSGEAAERQIARYLDPYQRWVAPKWIAGVTALSPSSGQTATVRRLPTGLQRMRMQWPAAWVKIMRLRWKG